MAYNPSMLMAGSPQAQMGIGQNPSYGGYTPNNANMGFGTNPNLYPPQGNSFNVASLFGGGGGQQSQAGGTQGRQGVTGGNPTAWDVQNSSGQLTGHNIPGGGVPAGATGGGVGGGAQGAAGGGAFNLQALLNAQQQSNDAARKQNQGNWDSSKNYLLGVAGNYAKDPTQQAATGLTNKFMANPEALNDATMAKIKGQAALGIRSGVDNAFQNQQGILAARGENDAGSLAAAQKQSDLAGIMATTNSNTNLDIQRAQQRNQDYMNAMNQGRMTALQNAQVPMNVGNSIMNNLPQIKPDDYTGLGGLALAQMNQNNLLGVLGGMRTPMTGAQGSIGGNSGGMDSQWQEQVPGGFSGIASNNTPFWH